MIKLKPFVGWLEMEIKAESNYCMKQWDDAAKSHSAETQITTSYVELLT